MVPTEVAEETQRSTEEAGKKLSYAIIGCAMRVHTALGPGLLESVYEECLCHELALDGIGFERQVDIPLSYRGFALSPGLRLDLLVEGSVIVEVKSVEALLRVHHAQLLTYLQLARKHLGLLINFNVPHLRDGICRKIN